MEVRRENASYIAQVEAGGEGMKRESKRMMVRVVVL